MWCAWLHVCLPAFCGMQFSACLVPCCLRSAHLLPCCCRRADGRQQGTEADLLLFVCLSAVCCGLVCFSAACISAFLLSDCLFLYCTLFAYLQVFSSACLCVWQLSEGLYVCMFTLCMSFPGGELPYKSDGDAPSLLYRSPPPPPSLLSAHLLLCSLPFASLLSVWLHFCLAVCLFVICTSASLLVCLSVVCMSVCSLSAVCIAVSRTVCLYAFLLFSCLYVCLFSVCLLLCCLNGYMCNWSTSFSNKDLPFLSFVYH